MSDSSEPSIQAAPSEILDAVRAVALAKGEDAQTSDALEAVAHLVYGNPNLTLQDLMAVGQAAQVQDVAKAAKKKDEPDAEAEEEGYDEESEQDPSDDEDDGDGDDEDEEDGEAEDKKGKKMPAFLKEKLKKGGPGSGPQKDGGSSDDKTDDSKSGGDFGRRGSGSKSDPGLKGQPKDGKEIKLQGASREANKASEKATGLDSHKAAMNAHYAAAKSYRAAAEKKGVSDSDKATYTAAANNHSEKGGEHFAARQSALKKSQQSADTSANQGGPMEAETAEVEVAISKSQYDSIREELAKSEARIAAFEHKEALAIEKSANEAKYADLTLDHDALAKSMLALRKSSPEQVEALEQSLAAANEQVRVSKASGASIFAQKSSNGFAAPATASADKFRAMVEEHVAKSGGSRAQAIAAIAKTKDGIQAYKEMQGSN